MARPSIWLAPFDRDRTFTVRRAFRCEGCQFGPGDRFDKTLVTTRKLRQLYESRFVVMQPETAEQPQPQYGPPPDDGWHVPLDADDLLAPFKGKPWLTVRKEIKELTGVAPQNKPHAVEIMKAHRAAA